ncbi:MAG: hypothetical protein ACRD5W_17645 [Candidatus Acidiferrales bacterium]
MNTHAVVRAAKSVAAAAVLLACSASVKAQELRAPPELKEQQETREPAEVRNPQSERKPWYKSKLFWATTALAVTAAVADAETTQRALKRCPTCVESNPMLGSWRPGRGRLYWIGGITLAIERGVVIALWKRQPQAADAVMFGATAMRVAYHGRFAYQNAQIPRECPANGAGCAP